MTQFQTHILPEVVRALEGCRERIESNPFADIMIRVHDGKPTIVEITTRHRPKDIEGRVTHP